MKNKKQLMMGDINMGQEDSWKRIPNPVLHKQEICQRKQNKDDQQEQNDKLHN